MPLSSRHVVGRDDSCDQVLPGSEISRFHAEFRLDGAIVAVRDRDSRNGLVVNGLRCSDARLQTGDVVRCGEWIGVVVTETPPVEFQEIASRWWGGATLSTVVEPMRHLVGDLRVVIQGETGTGKEGMARALHEWSGRKGKFVAINCAALPAELADAEFFGHRRGAFTGADVSSLGLFRAADRGTLFLDEVLDLPLTIQAKLLRVLQEGEVRALGDTHDVKIDVRVLSATQTPLGVSVDAARFRADLYARLDDLTVTLPSLRERREDVLPLFFQFLRDRSGGRPPAVEARLAEALCLYDWPFNVRELVSVTQQLLSAHAHKGELKKSHLPQRMLERLAPLQPAEGEPAVVPEANRKRAWRKTDDDDEFKNLVEALRLHDGSVAKAASAMGIGRARAYRLIAAHPEFSIEATRR